jgi:hypothetical protein
MATPPDFVNATPLDASSLNAVGLWKITEVAFLAQTQVDFINVFTSDYSDYRIEFQEWTATAAANQILRLRDAGGLISTNNYVSQRTETVGTTISPFGTGAIAHFSPTFVAASAGAAVGASGYVDMFQPQVSGRYTRFAGAFSRTDSTTSLYAINSTGIFNLTTVCTGFSLIRDGTATISGTVRVYGYRK